MATADGRVTAARLTPGTALLVEEHPNGSGGIYYAPTRRKRAGGGVVRLTVRDVEAVKHGRVTGRRLTFENGETMHAAPSTTFTLA